MATGDKPPSLHDLEARLRAARATQAQMDGTAREQAARHSRDKIGVGMRIAIELVAGVVVGAAIGLGLDMWLGTRPWLLILFFILGSSAGFMNVYRVAKAEDKRQAAEKAAALEARSRENKAGNNEG